MRSQREKPLLRLVLSRLLEQGEAALHEHHQSARDDAALCRTIRSLSMKAGTVRPCA